MSVSSDGWSSMSHRPDLLTGNRFLRARRCVPLRVITMRDACALPYDLVNAVGYAAIVLMCDVFSTPFAGIVTVDEIRCFACVV